MANFSNPTRETLISSEPGKNDPWNSMKVHEASSSLSGVRATESIAHFSDLRSDSGYSSPILPFIKYLNIPHELFHSRFRSESLRSESSWIITDADTPSALSGGDTMISA